MSANALAGFLHVCRLGTLRALDDLKFHQISFLQSTIPVAYDCGVMDKNIRAIVSPDKAIPL